jgi:hypothetical protein
MFESLERRKRELESLPQQQPNDVDQRRADVVGSNQQQQHRDSGQPPSNVIGSKQQQQYEEVTYSGSHIYEEIGEAKKVSVTKFF